jgi:hypothetical protein
MNVNTREKKEREVKRMRKNYTRERDKKITI